MTRKHLQDGPHYCKGLSRSIIVLPSSEY